MAALPDRLTAALAGRYQVERLLGSGGMADVYLAQDLKHARRVAIKVLKPELAAALGRERFLREIQLASTLQHPYILKLWDSGVAGDLLYYIMPYLEGDTLRQRLDREKQLPVEDALRITGEIAEALDYAHRQGVVHRDIKPENILFEGGHALVADFGIARAVGLAGGTKLTETGVTLGTSAYMSPEQVLGGAELDGRSDLYSLACVTYEMLAGQPPFTGATAESIVHQHVAAPPRSVSDLRATVSPGLAAVLALALAKAPADRHAGTAEFARALRTAATEPATIEAAANGVALWMRRPRLILGAIGLVAVAAGLFTWWIEFRGRAAVADPTKKDLILVARFEGPEDDPGLAPAVRNMITAVIDQSGIAATVTDADLRQALQTAGKPDSTMVDAALARELAYRRSIRAVLEGQVSRLGIGYSITSRLVDVESDRTLLSVSETAPDQGQLVRALERLGHRLRSGLGEQRAGLKASRPLLEVATPDFEAYRLFVRGFEARRRGDDLDALRLTRAALARDPDFGSAWRSLGVSLWNSGRRDSSRWAYEEASRHADRLGEWDQLDIEARLAFYRRDLPGQLHASERALQTNLTPTQLATTYNNRAEALSAADRHEEANESRLLSERVSPFGPSRVILANLVIGFARLGQFDEASKVVERIRDNGEVVARLELFRERWAAAESIAARVVSDSRQPLFRRLDCAVCAASGSAAQGRVARAIDYLRKARREARGAGGGTVVTDWVAVEAKLAAFAGLNAGELEAETATDTTFDSALSRAFRAMVSGRETAAEMARVLGDQRSRRADYSVRVALLEGWGALRSGRTQEGKSQLRALALQTGGPYYTWYENLDPIQQARWLLAGIYEREGKPDSAAVCLELLLAPVGRYRDLIPWRGFHYSFAHQRLVLLYARMGQVDAARRHLEAFDKAFTNPDPELRHLVDEAHAALAAAEAMGKGVTR